RERRAAAAGRRGVRIANDELRAGEVFLVVDLGTLQVLDAQRIDEERHAALLDLRVPFLRFLVEREAVLETGAAAALDVDAQLQVRIALGLDELTDLRRGRIGEMQRRLTIRPFGLAHCTTLRPASPGPRARHPLRPRTTDARSRGSAYR